MFSAGGSPRPPPRARRGCGWRQPQAWESRPVQPASPVPVPGPRDDSAVTPEGSWEESAPSSGGAVGAAPMSKEIKVSSLAITRDELTTAPMPSGRQHLPQGQKQK